MKRLLIIIGLLFFTVVTCDPVYAESTAFSKKKKKQVEIVLTEDDINLAISQLREKLLVLQQQVVQANNLARGSQEELLRTEGAINSLITIMNSKKAEAKGDKR